MYKFRIKGLEKIQEYEELIKVFLRPGEFRVLTDEENGLQADERVFSYEGDKNRLKREIYENLAGLTGLRPKWGILTGIRPVKLAGEIFETLGSEEAAEGRLTGDYLLDPRKAKLILDIYQDQQRLLGKPPAQSAGVYAGIPFCPTRCLYCSFTSNQVGEGEMVRYLEALYQEIDFVGTNMALRPIQTETVYIGGGTPTTLTAGQLSMLLGRMKDKFDLSAMREMTVEAGRPDTITPEKLDVLRAFPVDRISINPQSMKEETLALIGRSHTTADTRNAFQITRKAGIHVINADIIAGLPGETSEDFQRTVTELLELGAENITVHTLAVKRASRLKEIDEDFHYKQAALVEEMLEYADRMLRRNTYKPYYLYRQKHTSGSTENIGYCKDGAIGIYNIRIMEEKQHILALGAGGMTKVYDPEENRLSRIPNVSNYEIYIQRIDEMLQRKANHLFRR